MKVSNIRLPQDPNKSFIVLRERNPFSKWHHHPEYELVLIVKRQGKADGWRIIWTGLMKMT